MLVARSLPKNRVNGDGVGVVETGVAMMTVSAAVVVKMQQKTRLQGSRVDINSTRSSQ